jgi:hypothetical protein
MNYQITPKPSMPTNPSNEFDVRLLSKGSGLPSPSEICGIDLVTEGILTLTDVVQRIEKGDALADKLPLASKKMVEFFRNSDEIELVVGTKVNEVRKLAKSSNEAATRISELVGESSGKIAIGTDLSQKLESELLQIMEEARAAMLDSLSMASKLKHFVDQ